MGKIVALLDDESRLGFKLTGIETRRAESPEALAAGVKALASDPEVRIVILDETLLRRLPPRIEQELEQSIDPVFVPIPAIRLLREAVKPEKYVARLIRRAIGYQIKIRRT